MLSCCGASGKQGLGPDETTLAQGLALWNQSQSYGGRLASPLWLRRVCCRSARSEREDRSKPGPTLSGLWGCAVVTGDSETLSISSKVKFHPRWEKKDIWGARYWRLMRIWRMVLNPALGAAHWHPFGHLGKASVRVWLEKWNPEEVELHLHPHLYLRPSLYAALHPYLCRCQCVPPYLCTDNRSMYRHGYGHEDVFYSSRNDR